MMPKKCPRCEINYLMDGEKICSVCRKSVHMEDEPDEIVEMCSECGEHPAMPGSELCAFCRKELARRTPVVSMPEDEIEPSLQMDSVATMDEIELDLGDDLATSCRISWTKRIRKKPRQRKKRKTARTGAKIEDLCHSRFASTGPEKADGYFWRCIGNGILSGLRRIGARG